QVTGLFSTNAAGTHLSPVGHSSCFVDFCCAAGIAASEMQTPWLLPDFLLVQHACGGGPASADGAGAPHAFLCTPIGWQNGVGALPCVGSVQGTHSCPVSQTSCFKTPAPCFSISGKSGAVTQPPAPTIEVHAFGLL